MKRILLAMTLMLNCSCSEAKPDETKPVVPPEKPSVFKIAGNKEYETTVDKTSLLRNPCSGWGLYDDAAGEVANADDYWIAQDRYARKYASFFYLRWRWSDMEPEEGKYAWVHDENYKKLIQGALDRGLRLAFRIYNNGRDNLRPGTPNFVKEAGARGYYVEGGGGQHWTPYVTDPVFRNKLANFVAAFAAEYDNPAIVDFVDGVNMGSWGECHGLEIENPTQQKKDEVLDWVTSLYSTNFKHVHLIMPINSEFGHNAEMDIASGKNGFGFRRDGLGSMWFYQGEKDVVEKLYPSTLLIGESCYWGGDQSDNLWFDDDLYHFKTWKDVYNVTFKDAVDYHFNTLDLRTPTEAQRWVEKTPELVQKFIEIGGYRLYPQIVSAPETAKLGSEIKVGHRWCNLATGIFPNNNVKWNNKYKVALALIDVNNVVKNITVDTKSDPSKFLKDVNVDYVSSMTISGLSAGSYTLAIAIVDTTNDNLADIKLATKNQIIKGWTKISTIRID